MPNLETYDFENYYGSDPWGNITLDERPWYDPILRRVYQRASVYSQFAAFKIDLAGGARARTITFSDLIPPRPNIAPIANRAMQSTRLYTDASQRDITVQRYGNGMAVHRESSMFDYWQKNGEYGIIPILNSSMGQVITDHLDTLARNAFFTHPFPTFGAASASNPAALSGTDKMSTDIIDSVWLGMMDRPQPFQPIGSPFPTGDELICITTPGVVYDLKREVGTGTGGLNFVDVAKYNGAAQLLSGELGMYRGVRFVQNQFAKLENVGAVSGSTPIKAPVEPGDGAPDPTTTKVEGAHRVGQPGATHYIQVTDASLFARNQRVTIHRIKHDADSLAAHNNVGVLNGVVFDDPMAQTLEIYNIDTVSSPNRIIFKEPYMMVQDNGKGLETDLGSSVYGYVTAGKHLHSTLFLNPMMTGIVAGVAQPPVLYTPPPTDDYMSMYRLSYDLWIKYAMWEARAYDMRFLAGASKGITGGVTY